jgi:DnaJ-domain-containing protein 1
LRVFFIGGSFLYAARSFDRDEGDRHFNFYKIRDIPLVHAPWLMKFVGTLWNPVPYSAPDGYYLFADGSARAFHPGTIGIEPGAALSTLGVAALVSLMFESAAPMNAAAQVLNDSYARAVIAFFEEVLARPVVPKVPLDWSKLLEKFKPKEEDPYATLGVTPSATREEVHKAHRDKSASVHPDKVATLAPEFQKFAHDLFVRVQAAHVTIKLQRGWA